jgi:hypothetical protein
MAAAPGDEKHAERLRGIVSSLDKINSGTGQQDERKEGFFHGDGVGLPGRERCVEPKLPSTHGNSPARFKAA